MNAPVLAIAELAAAGPVLSYAIATVAVVLLAWRATVRQSRRARAAAIGGAVVAVAGLAAATWPCRVPSPWPMELAGHFCREFPLRARTVVSGTGALPDDVAPPFAWVRTEADLARLGAWRAGLAGAELQLDREWLLILVDPGAARPPRLVDLHQDWDHGATIVATLAETPGDAGPREGVCAGPREGAWAAIAVERASLWREPGRLRFLLRAPGGRFYLLDGVRRVTGTPRRLGASTSRRRPPRAPARARGTRA